MHDFTLADHPFRIRPNQKVSLADLPTRDESLFPISKGEGKGLAAEMSNQIDELQEQFYAQSKHRLLVVFQAMDTGGKDGTIRSVFEKMDPQGVRVAPFKKPSEIELAHDYLWRVHQEVPQDGEVVIFNRSHYEDIIAVRVKNIAPEDVWSKRYQHLVNFEQMLIDEGTTVVKIFLHISKEEQRERLQARLDDPAKHWKFNVGDLDDRARWDDFMSAYEDVLERTSTDDAPWYVVPADRKWYRNLIVSDIIIKTMEGLKMTYPSADFDASTVVVGD